VTDPKHDAHETVTHASGSRPQVAVDIDKKLMHDDRFHAGDELWLRGQRVTFVGYHRHAPHSIGAAVVRRHDEKQARLVPLRKLTRDREESLVRANAIAVR
jgi:hypothetical protein